jgi:hypothetical protein
MNAQKFLQDNPNHFLVKVGGFVLAALFVLVIGAIAYAPGIVAEIQKYFGQ